MLVKVQWTYIISITLFVSFESNRCRTGAGWIEIVRVRAEFPSRALPRRLCQLNARLGEAGTEFVARTLSAERGERRLHGWELATNRINYQRWLLSPIIHMTSVDSIPSLPGHHPPHSQCIFQVNTDVLFQDIMTWCQVLLVSPPPQTDNDSLADLGSDMVYNKPFAPWKPGDAYSVESDLSDWRLLLGSVRDGGQSRWGRKMIYAASAQ